MREEIYLHPKKYRIRKKESHVKRINNNTLWPLHVDDFQPFEMKKYKNSISIFKQNLYTCRQLQWEKKQFTCTGKVLMQDNIYTPFK